MSHGYERVLVVDDNVEMARLLADQLGDAGFEVARWPAAARRRWRRLKQQPFDVVVTDLRMEKVDGIDVLEGGARASTRACR